MHGFDYLHACMYGLIFMALAVHGHATYACMVFENIFIATSYNYTGHTYITGHACMHALQVIAIYTLYT